MTLKDYLHFLHTTYSKSNLLIAFLDSNGKACFLNARYCQVFNLDDADAFQFFQYFQKEIPINEDWISSCVDSKEFSHSIEFIKEVNEKHITFKANLDIIEIDSGNYLLATFNVEENLASKAISENELIHKILDIIPDNIFVKDINSNFILANKPIAQLMSTNTEDIVGKCDHDYYPTQLANHFLKDEKSIIESGESLLDIEEEILTPKGEKVWFLTSKLPLTNDKEETIGIVGISKDITERKKEKETLEEAKRQAEIADQLKSAFLANMSHELRTPLNGILGFAQFLRQDTIPEEKRVQYVDIIFHNGKHLLQIINNVIDVAKIDAGEIFIKKEKFQLHALLNKVEKETRKNIEQKSKQGIDLLKQLDSNQEIELFSDETRLEQVFDNLLSNAIKFTTKGEIKFGYKLHGQDTILFFISDTGVGIPKEKHEVIFKRFRQADDSLTRKYGGIGLGLTIAKGLIEMLGGEIWFESIKESGTTFYFALPVLKEEITTKAEFSLSVKWRNKKILIAEDENTGFLFLQALFKEQFVEVIRANNGAEAISKVDEYEFTVVLMDLRMPDIDGLAATKAIKAKNPDLKIIATTAYSFDNDEKKSLDAGCDYYIPKPINKKKLFSLLNELI